MTKTLFAPTAAEVVALAEWTNSNSHAPSTSAVLCAADARNLLDVGDEPAALVRALKSLAYSIGALHPDYVRAAAMGTSC